MVLDVWPNGETPTLPGAAPVLGAGQPQTSREEATGGSGGRGNYTLKIVRLHVRLDVRLSECMSGCQIACQAFRLNVRLLDECRSVRLNVGLSDWMRDF